MRSLCWMMRHSFLFPLHSTLIIFLLQLLTWWEYSDLWGSPCSLMLGGNMGHQGDGDERPFLWLNKDHNMFVVGWAVYGCIHCKLLQYPVARYGMRLQTARFSRQLCGSRRVGSWLISSCGCWGKPRRISGTRLGSILFTPQCHQRVLVIFF